jgi:flagellar biosynthesis regulator FlbT
MGLYAAELAVFLATFIATFADQNYTMEGQDIETYVNSETYYAALETGEFRDQAEFSNILNHYKDNSLSI